LAIEAHDYLSIHNPSSKDTKSSSQINPYNPHCHTPPVQASVSFMYQFIHYQIWNMQPASKRIIQRKLLTVADVGSCIISVDVDWFKEKN